MKLGILGTGMIVQDLLKTYDLFNIEKTYILSTPHSLEKANDLVKQYHLDKIYTDYDELLESDIDTVYVALPNHLHYSFAKKALLKGKHIIMEKPITSNSRELEELIEIASNNKLIIIEAVNLHHLPAFKSLKEDLDKCGKIKIVSFNYSQYSSRYNAFKEGTILPAFDYHKSGGALMDLNVYNINALVGLFGEPKDNTYSANISKGIDTSGIMTLDYGDFKAVSIGAKDCKAPMMNTIQGDQAAIVINSQLSIMHEYTIYYNNGESEVKTFENDHHRLYYEFIEFIDIIDHLDYDRAKVLLNNSLIISKLMEKGRKQEGIIFDND